MRYLLFQRTIESIALRLLRPLSLVPSSQSSLFVNQADLNRLEGIRQCQNVSRVSSISLTGTAGLGFSLSLSIGRTIEYLCDGPLYIFDRYLQNCLTIVRLFSI